MTGLGRGPVGLCRPTTDTAEDDRQARAAQVLSAVASGLTSTPKELSSKHRANRGAVGSAEGGAVPGERASTAGAKPALQKIRDYQLQVTLRLLEREVFFSGTNLPGGGGGVKP